MFLDKKKFAKILNLQLVKKNISQAQFAKKILATQQSVGKWIKGERDVKHTTLSRICRGLDVDPDIFADALVYQRPKKTIEQNPDSRVQ